MQVQNFKLGFECGERCRSIILICWLDHKQLPVVVLVLRAPVNSKYPLLGGLSSH